MKDEGTLQEIDAQPGDVVRVVGTCLGTPVGDGTIWTIKRVDEWYYGIRSSYNKHHGGTRLSSSTIFRMISRKEKPMTPPDIYNLTTPFGLLDEDTQFALKHHYDHGGDIEIYENIGWEVIIGPVWCYRCAYRAVRKPVIEILLEKMWLRMDGQIVNYYSVSYQPINVLYNTIDGVIDPSSYRVEAR